MNTNFLSQDIAPLVKIEGIEFFSDASSCICDYDSMGWSSKAISLIRSYGEFFSYFMHEGYLAYYGAEADRNVLTQFSSGDFYKKKLLVCVSGLESSHLEFKKFFDEVQRKDLSETDIFIPYVLNKGNAKLDDVIKPICKVIKLWAKKDGKKELVLIGVSNGGRIVRAIEAKLVNSSNTGNIKKIKSIAIVGACKGSSLVNLVNSLKLTMFLSKEIAEEMPTDSARSRQLNQDWDDAQFKGPKRDYTFIASPHDWLVPNYDSSLLEVCAHTARYAIFRGHGHVSLMDAVSKPVAELVFL